MELEPRPPISAAGASPVTRTPARASQRGDDHARAFLALSPSSFCANGLAEAPPRGRLVPTVFRHCRREHRARHHPRCAPVPSALPAPPRQATAASSVDLVMAPPRLGLRPSPRSTVDLVDPCPAPVHGPPPWTTSPEPTRGQASWPPRAAPSVL